MKKYDIYISKYYPPFIYPYSEAYDECPESIDRDAKVILSKKNYRKEFANLFLRIKEIAFEHNYTVKDETRLFSGDRCVTYSFIEKSRTVEKVAVRKEVNLVFCISILERFYCVYNKEIAYYYADDRKFLGQITSEPSDTFTKEERELVEEIEKLILEMKYEKIEFSTLHYVLESYKAFGKAEFTLFYGLFKDGF
jgi:hypothetical protein